MSKLINIYKNGYLITKFAPDTELDHHGKKYWLLGLVKGFPVVKESILIYMTNTIMINFNCKFFKYSSTTPLRSGWPSSHTINSKTKEQ